PLPYADITNPQSLNKYTYTWNNPLRYTDPNGHCPPCTGTEPAYDPNVVRELLKTVPAAATTAASTLALAGGAVVVSAYAAITRTTDADVANKKDEANLQATESKVAAENNEKLKQQPEPEASASSSGARKGGGRDDRKLNVDREQSAKANEQRLRKELKEAKAKANKTPEDKAKEERLKRALQREIDRQKKSEPHGKRKKGS
ncbi:MAG: hypothetical protein ACRD2L_02075, partial [Terriglobia bacterium]